jgi:phosphohistidine phosphatase SixA
VYVSQVGVLQNALHEPASQAPATVLFQYEDVGEVGETCVVGHDPGEADLAHLAVQAERQGVANRAQKLLS